MAGYFTNQIIVKSKIKKRNSYKIYVPSYMITAFQIKDENQILAKEGLQQYYIQAYGESYQIVDNINKFKGDEELSLQKTNTERKCDGTVVNIADYDENNSTYIVTFYYILELYGEGIAKENVIPIIDAKNKFKIGDRVQFSKN